MYRKNKQEQINETLFMSVSRYVFVRIRFSMKYSNIVILHLYSKSEVSMVNFKRNQI